MTNRVITRAGKGSPLLNSELDRNFTNLDRLCYYDQSLTNVSGTTGLILEDDTEFKFVPQMSPEYLMFIPATLTTEIQIHRDGNYGVYVQTDKKLRVNYGGTYTTLSALSVSDDWVNIQFSYNDNESSAVTFDTNINGVAFGSQQVVTYSDEFIRSIWASDYGFLHIASMGYGFLTNAATTKTQNWGDAIGALPSVAGNSVVLAQATSTARPLIGRVPVGGRRNLTLASENISNAAFGKTRTTTPDANTLVETVDNGSHVMTLGTVNATAGEKVYISLWLEKGSLAAAPDWIQISTGVTGFVANNAYLANFNLTTLTVGTVGAAASETSIENDAGYIRIRAAITAAATSAAAQGAIAFINNTDGGVRQPSYVGNVLSDVKVRRVQVELGGYTDYQFVGTTARDITESGILDQEYAFFDRADDILAGTIDAITDGEIIIAGRNGVWHDSLTVSAGTWQIGATTYTGGPAGILAVIGDFIGAATLSGRAFTTAERDAIYALFKERGAPGVFTISGSELITNGTFDTDTTGWAGGDAESLLSVSSGRLRMENGDATGASATQTGIALSSGVTYMVSGSLVSNNSINGRLIFGPFDTSNFVTIGGSFRYLVTYNGVLNRIILSNGSNQTLGNFSEWDNISVKAITLTPWS